MEEKEYWYWLCNIKGIGNKKINELLEQFENPQNIYSAGENTLSKVKILSKTDIHTIILSREKNRVKEEYEKLKEKGIIFLTKYEERYPKRLRNIYDAPIGLYIKGNIPEENRIAIAIVGARNCSYYGKEVAYHFAKKLSEAGVQVISGLARGIDGHAHRGALASGHGTYGVLGCGIDICYPSSNLELFMTMQEQGGIISEYGLGVYPMKGNFPMRNRLISGMSDGILVVEAREKSGSLITADMGLEQGKDIFAVPGRIFDELSTGCNNLIKMGAQPVSGPEDILENYHIKLCENTNINNYIFQPREKIVYDCLSLTPKHIYHITEEIKMPVTEIMEILMGLEIKEYIRQTGKNYYVRF